MNWKVKSKVEKARKILPSIGDIKEQKRFALIPVKVECGVALYWVWLEWYTVVKEYKATLGGTDMDDLNIIEKWVVVRRKIIITNVL